MIHFNDSQVKTNGNVKYAMTFKKMLFIITVTEYHIIKTKRHMTFLLRSARRHVADSEASWMMV